MKTKPKFDGKPLEVKFDNYAIFRLVKLGLSEGDLLATPNSDENKYCAAWAAVLGVEYDGNAREFMSRFCGSLLDINECALNAMERDGVIEAESKKKNPPRQNKK